MLPKIYAISNVLLHIDLGGEAVFVYYHNQIDYSFLLFSGSLFCYKILRLWSGCLTKTINA
jgi:hypothetical protein